MNTDKTQAKQLPQVDTKSRFFAQYWGTKTMYVGGVGLVEIGKGGWNLKHPDFFLQLKPLSKITDKDLIYICRLKNKKATIKDINFNDDSICLKIETFDDNEFSFGQNSLIYDFELSFKNIDYLRSKGYAVPFMEYSVDDLTYFGWVRLV